MEKFGGGGGEMMIYTCTHVGRVGRVGMPVRVLGRVLSIRNTFTVVSEPKTKKCFIRSKNRFS